MTDPPQAVDDTTIANVKPEEETKAEIAIDVNPSEERKAEKPETKRSLDDIYLDYKRKYEREPTQLNQILKYNQHFIIEPKDRWKYKEIKQWWVDRERQNNKSTSKHTLSTKPNQKALIRMPNPSKKQTKTKKTNTRVMIPSTTMHHEEEVKSNPPTPIPKMGKMRSLKRLVSSKMSSKSVLRQPEFDQIPENSPMSPSALVAEKSVHFITSDDIGDIMRILNDYRLRMTETQIKRILNEYNYKKRHMIDDLCAGHANDEDENIKLSKLLSDVGYKLVDRQKFYDVILKRFVDKNELTSAQFVIILIKTIQDLKLDDIDVNECRQVAMNAPLSGKVFTKSTSKQFAKVFASMGAVDQSVWQRIYHKMDEWMPYDYTQLDFETIRNIVRNDGFLNENEIEILESSLKTAPNIDAKEERQYRVKGYNENRLLDELCDAFTSPNDTHNPCNLTQILMKQLEWTGVAKRRQFYDILLHKYFKCNQLNTFNFVKILRFSIAKAEDWEMDEAAVATITDIARKNGLNGTMFVKGHEGFKSSTDFAKLFCDVDGYVRKRFAKLYIPIKQWKSKTYEQTDQLDFEAIRNILKNDRFLNENEIEIVESSLKTAPNIDTKKGYNEARLMDELCDAFTSAKDTHNPCNLTQILMKKLELTDVQMRRQFYDVLLHKYFKSNQLNTDNFAKILRFFITQVADWKMDKDTLGHITDIARKNALDGAMFVKGQKGFKSSTAFAKLFCDVDGYVRKRFVGLYVPIKQWKSEIYPPRPERVLVNKTLKINLIRNAEKDHELDPLPQYIHKCIWFQSWDEKIEALIDQAVLRLLQLSSKFWNETFVRKIYDSAINKYYDAVQDVFRETGKHQFFAKFIKQYYEREIELWKIKCKDTVLLTDPFQIYQKIQFIDFKEFDFDGDGQLDKEEVRNCFQTNGLRIEPYILDEMFNVMDEDDDGNVDIGEFDKWKNDPYLFEDLQYKKNNQESHHSNSDESGSRYFLWDEQDQEYQIYTIQLNETEPISILNDNRFKWMCYIPEIGPRKRSKFKHFHPGAKVNGFWEHMDSEKYDEASPLRERHLDQIFSVLNYYYRNKGKDRSPLAHRNKDDRKLKIRFMIQNDNHEDGLEEDYYYQLTWWNHKGRYETNAIAIKTGQIKVQQEEEEQKGEMFRKLTSMKFTTMMLPKPPTQEVIYDNCAICYLRFKIAESGLQWKWYDTSTSSQKLMGVCTRDGVDTTDDRLIQQLEASYLGNMEDNFVSLRFNKQFNDCLLPELTIFVRDILKVNKSADDYVFNVTFRIDEPTVMENMHQIAYTQNASSINSSFSRNIFRFINGRNTLHGSLTVADADAFVQRWMRMYRLYTDQQQQYFWCFILSIVTQIQYIDIEFENQLVLLPFTDDIDSAHGTSQSHISALIDYHDVQMEQEDAAYFCGSLIPPFDVWQHIQKDKNHITPISKCGILRRATPKHNANGQDKWMMHPDEPWLEFQFTEDDAVLHRMVDCIRKFVFEFELGHTPLWPWYQNSKFFAFSKDGYNAWMQKHNLVKGYKIESMTHQTDSELNEETTEPNKSKCCMCCMCKDTNRITKESAQNELTTHRNASIRHKRKWGALLLLNHQLERNVNYIRVYLEKVLPLLVDEACDDHQTEQKGDSQHEMRNQLNAMQQQLDHLQKSINTQEEDEEPDIDNAKRDKIKTFIQNQIQTKEFWRGRVDVLEDFKPNLENTTLDMDPYQLLLFEQFMHCCFTEPDKDMYKKNRRRKGNDGTAFFYRVFMDFWRNVPDFWTYSHDVLLLELVFRNGIDCDAILGDMAQSARKYESRYGAGFDNIVDKHPLHAFKTWCTSRVNILHRLKYVSGTIVNQLNSDANIVFNIFSDYQKESHLQFIRRKTWTYDNTNAGNDIRQSMDLGHRKPKLLYKHSEESIPCRDLYISRNIEQELFESLQAFDLMKYGDQLTRFMMHKLAREAKESHYVVLGHLFYSLPDPIAIQILKESKDTLQRAKPHQLKELCRQIEAGSIFKTSADLNIAEFFGDLAERDLVGADIWKEYSKEFENMAYKNIAEMEDDHMLFVLVTIPLPFHHGKCLIQLAQEQGRASFLNQQRIAAVVDHIYAAGYLKPQDMIQKGGLTWSGMLHTAWYHPFLFYLTAQGYHWVEGILYAEYLILLFAYAYFWPLLPDMETESKVETMWLHILEITFWCSSLGFMLYEIDEYFEKGKDEYFNFAMMGQTNVLDAGISVIWLALLALRVVIFSSGKDEEEIHEDMLLDYVQHGFVFLFAMQILLVTFRLFKIVNSSEYFGKMLRIIKLMLQEFIKFFVIFFMIMIASLFGIWFISGVHQKVDEPFWQNGFRFGFLYMFELFIGTKEISDWEFEMIPSGYLVITSMLGTLLLLNLLIATMASKYDEVKEQAHKEVILYKTELSFDLLRRSRHMPPPLNVILYLITAIILLLNLFVALLVPKWNVFGLVHYDAFENMKIFNCWRCRHKKCTYPGIYGQGTRLETARNKPKVEPLKYFAEMSRCDVFAWFFGCDRIKIHHTGCYGSMKLFSNPKKKKSKVNVDGITMSKYFEHYEENKKRLISRQDRIVLNKLTANTLFCPKCYHGFTNTDNKKRLEKEFVSPLVPLFDYISAIVFVAIPIAWIPILIIVGAAVLKDRCFGRFKSDQTNENYSNKDYDRNYFPQFIPSKVMCIHK
eukprot:763015_1